MSKKAGDLLKDEASLNEVAQSAFQAVDVDKSGFISATELQNLMNSVSKQAGIAAPTAEEVREAMRALDTNSDGKISFEEFKVLVREILQTLSQ